MKRKNVGCTLYAIRRLYRKGFLKALPVCEFHSRINSRTYSQYFDKNTGHLILTKMSVRRLNCNLQPEYHSKVIHCVIRGFKPFIPLRRFIDVYQSNKLTCPGIICCRKTNFSVLKRDYTNQNIREQCMKAARVLHCRCSRQQRSFILKSPG